jgi:hypothetical protein
MVSAAMRALLGLLLGVAATATALQFDVDVGVNKVRTAGPRALCSWATSRRFLHAGVSAAAARVRFVDA